MSADSREKILRAATLVAQAHGYNGLNFRDLAESVGLRPASVYHHFASKAELAEAVARRYWEDHRAALEAIEAQETKGAKAEGPLGALRRYPESFRWALENENRMCLSGFMAAEFDDLPAAVKREVQSFADVNVAWLSRMLTAAKVVGPKKSEARARAIYAAVAGAQLMARSRADLPLYDAVIESYRRVGLLPE